MKRYRHPGDESEQVFQLLNKTAGRSPINIMKPSMQTSEFLSALADGQLGDEDFSAVLEVCQHDESALTCWGTYHLIGDVLRSPERTPVAMAEDDQLAFISRLNNRLAQEPRIKVELGSANAELATPNRAAIELIRQRGPAANEGNFRWKLVAGFASLAAISAIAWNASGLLAPASSPQLAQAASPQVVVASPQGLMVRDARLEELLAAHRQLGGTSVLQEPSGFMRNATFDMPQNAGR